MDKKVKVRFAPSPTGALHIGGVRTALFNYLFAKKHGGEFLLRIEDTDQTRFVKGAEKYIFDSLAWLGISPDNSVNPDGTAKYKQSEREYRTYVDALINHGHAYYAFDTSEEIEAMKKTLIASGISNPGYTNVTRGIMKNSFTLSAEDVKAKIDAGVPYAIRFNTPKNKEVKFLDAVKGWVTFNSNTMDDKVLFKSDGLPTYHLANVVDDHLMEISHVIRGDEWLSSAPLHIMLYDAFGWDAPEFCHLPLILDNSGKKMSKRHTKTDKDDKTWFPTFPLSWNYVNEKDEPVSIVGFKEENYEPDALVNFLALLGWNPGGTKEIMPLSEMISLFELNRINNSSARFDIDKLKNFNAHYLRARNNDDLFAHYVLPILKEGILSSVFTLKPVPDRYVDKTYNESEINTIIEMAKERSVFNVDLYPSVSYFFETIFLKNDVVLKNSTEFHTVMNAFLTQTENFDENFSGSNNLWKEDAIKSFLDEICVAKDIKINKVLPDLRMALTGGLPGPSLPLTMEVLGRDESVRRIAALLEKTKEVAS